MKRIIKTLCSICVRGGSKGVSNKNIRMLAGKPLIAHTIEQAKEADIFDHIVVSTDSDEIAEVAIKFGGEVFFKRPMKLATDTAPKIPVIRHALLTSEEQYKMQFDVQVDLDATSPLRNSTDIVNAFNQFISDNNSNIFSVTPSRRSPYFNMVELSDEGRVVLSKTASPPIIRRQDASQCYDMNASIYIWKRDILLQNDSIFLEKTGIFLMPEERSMDIDSERDFEIVDYLMTRNR